MFMSSNAARARDEGRSVFIVQLRGAASHSPRLSSVVPGVAEQIEAIEAQGWRLDQFTSVPYEDNITTTCLFRLAGER